ncbi:MAG: hypothetical protein MI723_08585, partial [Caulobacterales bacterium]|nr:hypothetical protein [Caulobacterales bacterium]
MTAFTRRAMLAAPAAAVLARGAPAGAGTGAWRALSPLPAPAQEIYPTAWRGQLLVAGGFTVRDGDIGPTDRAFVYDRSRDAWSEGPHLPTPRHHPQLIAAGERLYALAGFEARDRERAWAMQAGGWFRDAEAPDWE